MAEPEVLDLVPVRSQTVLVPEWRAEVEEIAGPRPVLTYRQDRGGLVAAVVMGVVLLVALVIVLHIASQHGGL